jgi:hypothetical protein
MSIRPNADMVERLASVASRQLVSRQGELEFWRHVGQRAKPELEQEDRRQQARRHGR